MPELPELEHARRLAERLLLGRTIARVLVDDDRIVFDGVAPRTVANKLRGRTVVGVHRRGKQLWFELDRPPHPLFHFGMTGGFHTPDGESLRMRAHGSKPFSADWPPRFTKIHLTADNGAEIVMTNSRRLGRIRLRDDPLHEPPISRLGFDPLLDLPAPGQLGEALAGRRTPIKALLLDQSFAAGVGNWIADEVLYQAKIDPRRRASDLGTVEVKRLHGKLRSVIVKAVEVDAVKSRFPKTWLFHYRWGKVADARTARGERIEFLTVGGRTTAWVPEVQGPPHS